MLLFVLFAALLTIVCIAMIWPAMNRKKPLTEVDIRQENLEIARQRLEEVRQSNDPNNTHQTELEAAFLDDLEGPDYNLKQNRPGSLFSSMLILAVLPITATVAYVLLGNTQWQNQNVVSVSPETQTQTHPGGDINSVLAGLEKSLSNNPENADGWALAGRTYMSMGRYVQAEQAYARVDRLSGGHPDILTAWADASLMANGGQFTDEISLRVQRALSMNPNQKNALWIAGIGAQAKGDHVSAIGYLQKLRPMLGNDTDAARRVDSLIAQSTDGQAAQPILATSTEDSIDGGIINVSVDISEDIRSQTTPNDTVFIFARAPNGPPFPLAVMRITVAELPAAIKLDDSLAMIEGKNISSVEQVVVTARVSKGGKPIAQPGDLTSPTVTTSTAGSPSLSLIIDQVVQ